MSFCNHLGLALNGSENKTPLNASTDAYLSDA